LLVCTSFFFSSRRRHTRFSRDWSSDVCSSDLCLKMDRMFRQSNLYRDKWDEMRGDKTYGEMTLLNAISTTSSVVSDHEPQHKPKIGRASCREESRYRWRT